MTTHLKISCNKASMICPRQLSFSWCVGVSRYVFQNHILFMDQFVRFKNYNLPMDQFELLFLLYFMYGSICTFLKIICVLLWIPDVR